MDRILFDTTSEKEVREVRPDQGNGGNVDPDLEIHGSGLNLGQWVMLAGEKLCGAEWGLVNWER